MNEGQRKALQTNHCLLVTSLDLSKSSVLDKLIEEGVISSGEQEEITSKVPKRNQNTYLLYVLTRKDSSKKPFDTFLQALQLDYTFIFEKIRSDVANCSIGTGIQIRCKHCSLKTNLIPNHVSDFLYEKGIISDDDLEDINNTNIPRQERVCTLLRILERSTNREIVNETFRTSLEKKYGYLLSGIETDVLGPFLVCCCQSKTASVCKHDNINESLATDNRYCSFTEKVYGQDTSDDEYYSCEETCHCQEIADQSNDCLTEKTIHRRYPVGRMHDEDTQVNKDHINNLYSWNDKDTSFESRKSRIKDLESGKAEKHSSEKTRENQGSCVTEKNGYHGYEFQENIVTPSHSNYESQVQILQHIHKVLPNDNRLMRLCKNIWNQLFLLREKGAWKKFDLVAKTAFEKFEDNPDIKELLYRTEMCVSTFYKLDSSKAHDMFDRASKILPKTSMTNWHLAIILSLKMELCTQAKKFEEASSLLEQAHQATMTLSPCFSTGAVYFFEALYLGTILRCTAKGTKSAKAIAERVKTCFLTAISHYQQEQFFGIKSFLNQVYLFLALFSLGVDFKKIRYIETQIVSEDDISLAEHYLNRFENNCWEDSTNWSQMLFFIARGEQHKQRNNLNRSLDYFQDARERAVLGSFDEHLGFIDMNIQFVGDKQERHIKHNEIQSWSDAILQSSTESTDSSNSG